MAGEFGTQFMPRMTISHFNEGWGPVEMVSSDSLTVHPGAHVIHYASTCFEGLKAFRHEGNSVKVFRMDRNIERFKQSSELLYLPPIDTDHTAAMIKQVLVEFADQVPEPPASMYIRPTHMGTEAAIGKAAAPSDTSTQFILLSPVGDYFVGGEAKLRLLIDDQGVRCGPDHGRVKAGGNYASALKHIMRAKKAYQADQVLFCPDGDIQETGAANFIVVSDDTVWTKPLDDSFLHGVTRDSLLTLAAEKGLKVREENFSVKQLLDMAAQPDCEAGLAGTAAVVAAVTTLIFEGKEYAVGKGAPGPIIRDLRSELNAIQWGQQEDRHGWMTTI